MANSRLKVFLSGMPWDMRSRNTDWRYVRHSLPQLSRFYPELEIAHAESLAMTLRGNAATLAGALGRRVGLSPSQYAISTARLSPRELRASGADVIFTREFPLNAGDVPVAWENAVVDPEMQRSFGVTDAAIAEEIEAKRPLFARSARVQVFSEAEMLRHRATYPESAEKFFWTPWFAPHAVACEESLLEKHDGPAVVRVLFVGNNAQRKGLVELLQAFTTLPESVRGRAELTVISNFDRSRIALPAADPRVRVVKGTTSAQVMEAMRASHIFVNVAHFESYGLVFHEAMSQGLAVLAPDWEVQRELCDNGRAGLNLKPTAEAIRSALERLIMDDEERMRVARAGWTRFTERYAPAVVARRYRDLLFEAAAARR